MAMELRGHLVYNMKDFDEMGNLNIKISAGRLRHRWVPTTRHLRSDIDGSEDATGLRTARDSYILGNQS